MEMHRLIHFLMSFLGSIKKGISKSISKGAGKVVVGEWIRYIFTGVYNVLLPSDGLDAGIHIRPSF